MVRGLRRSKRSVLVAAQIILAAATLAASALTATRVSAEPVVNEARIESARGVALGSGVRASGAATQAQADNPANLPLGGLYHVETFFGYQPQLNRFGVGGSVVDSMTSKVAMGFSARALFGENDAGDNKGFEGRLGLGLPIGDMVSVGLAGRYANLNLADEKARPRQLRGLDENGEPRYSERHKLKGFTLDAAVTLRPIGGLAIAALAYNLINQDTPLAPMMVGGSASYTLQSALTLGGDVLVDLNKHDQFNGVKLKAGGGVEYLAQGVAPLRLGYLYDQGRHQHAITAGLGYVSQQFGIQLSLRHVLGDHKDTTLFTALQYFVQ